MAGMGAGYDLSVSTFSPDGRLFQTEYAAKAVDNSNTVIALVCSDGIITAAEKQLPNKMIIPGSAPRIYAVDKHCCVTVCGFTADGRQIALRARHEAAQYQHLYGVRIPGHVLAERVAMFMHVFTLAWSIRPFGASVLLSVYDKQNNELPQLYNIELSGTCHKYFAMALGKGRQTSKTELEKLGHSKITCAEAVNHMAKIMCLTQDLPIKPFEIEMAWISSDSNFDFQRVPADLVKQAEEIAIKAINERDQAD